MLRKRYLNGKDEKIDELISECLQAVNDLYPVNKEDGIAYFYLTLEKELTFKFKASLMEFLVNEFSNIVFYELKLKLKPIFNEEGIANVRIAEVDSKKLIYLFLLL
ncbi:hypothetical protein [Desulfurobacterium crinifex]